MQKVNVNSPVMNPKHPANAFDQLFKKSGQNQWTQLSGLGTTETLEIILA